jgi:hypothetical protein
VYDLKHQKEKRSMDHFAGLDVSVKETSVCIVDDTGKIVREVIVRVEGDQAASGGVQCARGRDGINVKKKTVAFEIACKTVATGRYFIAKGMPKGHNFISSPCEEVC